MITQHTLSDGTTVSARDGAHTTEPVRLQLVRGPRTELYLLDVAGLTYALTPKDFEGGAHAEAIARHRAGMILAELHPDLALDLDTIPFERSNGLG